MYFVRVTTNPSTVSYLSVSEKEHTFVCSWFFHTFSVYHAHYAELPAESKIYSVLPDKQFLQLVLLVLMIVTLRGSEAFFFLRTTQ